MQGLNNIHLRLQNFVQKIVFFLQKSKSGLDSLSRRQLEKINAVTEKYERIASSELGHLTSEQLFSLYAESEFPSPHTSVSDDDMDSSFTAPQLKPVLGIAQKLTQLSPKSHPRHLVRKRTAQKDAIKDITSDSQVNSRFPYR